MIERHLALVDRIGQRVQTFLIALNGNQRGLDLGQYLQQQLAIIIQAGLGQGFGRANFRAAATAIDQRYIQNGGQRGDDRRDKADRPQGVEADLPRNDQAGIKIGALDPHGGACRGKIGLGDQKIGAAAHQIRRHTARRATGIFGDAAIIVRQADTGGGRFADQDGQTVQRIGPCQIDQAALRLRARQIGGGAANVQIGGQPRLVTQRHDVERAFLQRAGLGEQIEPFLAALEFDIGQRHGGGDQAARVGQLIGRALRSRELLRNLRRQPAIDVRIERPRQTRCSAQIIVVAAKAAIGARLAKTVHLRQSVAAFRVQQRAGGHQPLPGRRDIQILRQRTIDQTVEFPVAKAPPPQLRLARRRTVGRRKICRQGGLRCRRGSRLRRGTGGQQA